MAGQKKIVIIAGPNGAGKTTITREFLPFEADCLTFINADLIAVGLSPFQPEAAAFRAGRVMRVRQGGHNIPPEIVRRRFISGMKNFLDVYRYRIDFWQWFDNSGPYRN